MYYALVGFRNGTFGRTRHSWPEALREISLCSGALLFPDKVCFKMDSLTPKWPAANCILSELSF